VRKESEQREDEEGEEERIFTRVKINELACTT
jgi:hypothetical protein